MEPKPTVMEGDTTSIPQKLEPLSLDNSERNILANSNQMDFDFKEAILFPDRRTNSTNLTPITTSAVDNRFLTVGLNSYRKLRTVPTSKGWSTIKSRLKEMNDMAKAERKKEQEIFEGKTRSFKQRNWMIFDPKDGFGLMLFALRGACVLITLLFCPFLYTFPPHTLFHSSTITLLIVDCLYFMILLFQLFAVGYHDQQNILVGDRRLIIKNFFKSYWSVGYRVYMLVPWYLIGPEFALLKMVGVFEIHKVLSFFPYLVHLFFVTFPRLDVSTLRIEFIKLFLNSMTMMALIFNITCCIWIRINDYASIDTAYSDYINGFYFSVETSSTIGYGDNTVVFESSVIDPQVPNDRRYLFAIFMVLLGLNYFAFVQSLIVKSINLWFEVDKIISQKHEDLNDWMAIRNNTVGSQIEWGYEKKLMEYFEYLRTQDIISVHNENGFFDRLSEKDKESIETYTTDSVAQRFDLFRDINRETTTQVILLGTPKTYEKNEIMLNVGDSSEGILLILSGQVEVSLKYKSGMIYLNPIGEGGYIGGSSISGGGSLYTYRSMTTTICLFIQKTSLVSLLRARPLEQTNLYNRIAKRSSEHNKLLQMCIVRIENRIQLNAMDEEQAIKNREGGHNFDLQLPSQSNKLNYPALEAETNQSKKINEPEPEHHIANIPPEQGKKVSILNPPQRKSQIVPLMSSIGSIFGLSRNESKQRLTPRKRK